MLDDIFGAWKRMVDMSLDTAIFAGGCFWCMVQPFDTYPGYSGHGTTELCGAEQERHAEECGADFHRFLLVHHPAVQL